MRNKIRKDISIEDARAVQRRFRLIALATVVTLMIGVIMMSYLEGLAIIDALYFSVVSLTTVGYGDFTPVTTGGKIFVMLYLINGIAIVAALIDNIIKSTMARRAIKEKEHEAKNN